MTDLESLENDERFNFAKLIDEENALYSECVYMNLDEDCNNTQTEHSLIVAHLNIHSLPSKFDELVELIDKLACKGISPDIILLCETFLNLNNFDRFTFQDYDLISEYRKIKSKGGVSILIKTKLKYHVRNDLVVFDEGKFESIFVEIPQINKPNIVIGEIYRVPGTNENNFLTEYENLIGKIKNENKRLIIGTDQNLDYLKINLHNNTMKFFELNMSHNLMPVIYKPTRVTHATATLIDNIYIDVEISHNVKSHIVVSDISDHFLCVAVIKNNNVIENSAKPFKTRKINDGIIRNIRGALFNKDWSYLEQLCLNQATDALNKEINEVIEYYAPLKTINVSKINKQKDKCPWFTAGLKKSSVKCLKLFQKVMHKPRESPEYKLYKEYRNMYQKLLRKAKFRFYNEIISERQKDSKKLWAVLNKIVGKTKNKKDICDEIIVNGVKETNEKTVGNAFAKFYSEIGKKLSDKLNYQGNNNTNDYITERINSTCYLQPASQKEIENIIKKLKPKNSKGYDNVSNRILKGIYPAILKALWIIFNKSLNNGEFPMTMKLAIVTPLYKSKNIHEICNYRPISLLPVISKVLEKIISNRLVKFFTKHKVLYEGQYGFRRQRSTTDAILDFMGNVLHSFNRGMFTIGIFLDMTKAFDSINHETLLNKLEKYGIRGIAFEWLKSYLSERKLQVKFKETLSDRFSVEFGTPQGSVLGPLLYIVLANDLIKSLKFCSSISFADDTTVYASGRNLKLLFKKVNEDLKQLNIWFIRNSLSLNIEKTNYIIFRMKNKKVKMDNNTIEIGGKEIKCVRNIRFLGVIIDENLDWSSHVKYLLSKLTAGIYSLNMVKNFLPSHIKRMIYLTNIQSHLNYAMCVWGPMLNSSNRNKIRVKQNHAVRAIFQVNRRTSVKPLLKKARLLCFDDMVDLSLLNISFRYINDTLPIRIVNLFEIQNHDQFTRNRNILLTPIHSLEICNKSFLGRTPHLWLNLSNNIKLAKTAKLFTKYFTKKCIDLY